MSKTRIIEAVRHLDLDTTRALLKATPALLTVTDRQGRNLLHLACSVCCPAVHLPESAAARLVTFLLDQGMAIETPMGRDKCTPLFFAVARGRNTTLIKLLIKRGASPARAPGGGLYAAGWFDDTTHLDLLVKAGASIDVVVGITPFLACWIWKKFDAAKFLARQGANVNFQNPKTGKSALHYGVEKEFDPALLAWLVAHGASPDVADGDGVTARVRASRKRDKKWHAVLS